MVFMTMPAMAGSLKPVEKQFVCMVNNTEFASEQIAVDIEGRTYYGCCPMCKDMLQKDASLRMATDPVSGARVDKAQAFIGADETGKVYYFESAGNLQNYAGSQETTSGTGMINSVSPDENKINITHEPIPALQWPRMTMDLPVSEDVDLSSFEAGDKVGFSLVLGKDKTYRVVAMEEAPEGGTNGHGGHGDHSGHSMHRESH